ncbi:hypothetical protein B296_00033533 [Ensete ventricosum]|uniref:ENT domain-containing protein n=1 Tax=Ensete ventricosum TaxID=4639 RepID=A0A426ZPM0_ENSVE|nr:hypothetical protein B296_00033533 [Ensete ventricosum]
MIFNKGNKVEVWNRREVPSGAWWSAEIVSGNGNNYAVRYDGYPADSSDLMSGDVVEVSDNNSWKLAEVLMVVDKNYCLVRLIGSSRELRADKSLVRNRLSWQDNKWMMIYKVTSHGLNSLFNCHQDSGKGNGGLLSKLSRQEKFGYMNCLPSENHGSPEKTCCISSTGTKKRPFYSPAETCNADRRKMRAIEKDGRCQGIIAKQLIQCLEKVDAVAYPGRALVEKCTCPSVCHRTTDSSKMVLRRGTQSSYKQKSLIRSSEPSNAESTSSSVGSCSVGSSPFRALQNHVTYSPSESYSPSDHAKTSCHVEKESSLPRKEYLLAEIHQLELNAYRSTLIALHASGPISWEQEALMTNLRLTLNISNDEHLAEVRNLIHSEIITETSVSRRYA